EPRAAEARRTAPRARRPAGRALARACRSAPRVGRAPPEASTGSALRGPRAARAPLRPASPLGGPPSTAPALLPRAFDPPPPPPPHELPQPREPLLARTAVPGPLARGAVGLRPDAPLPRGERRLAVGELRFELRQPALRARLAPRDRLGTLLEPRLDALDLEL